MSDRPGVAPERRQRSILFLDTASPVSSVAAGGHGEVLAERTIEQRRTSELLLPVIEEVLAEAGVALSDLHGIAALQGPGSFTGLRIGLATLMGLHQSLAIRATALPTLPILAVAAGPGAAGGDDTEVVAAVDAMRGDWVTQRFAVRVRRGALDAVPLSEPELLDAAALADRGPCRLAGFGVSALAEEPWHRGSAIELIEPPPLAAVAALRMSTEEIDWDPARLTSPIYFRPPAVTLPKALTLPKR